MLNYKYFILSFNTPYCISLIVPSTIEDFSRCFNILYFNICNSTYSPHEVIIIISGTKNFGYINYSKIYSEFKKCNTKIVFKLRKKRHNAASNRNMGYSLSKCSILSFFDVDDIMSIHRLYVINKIFHENKNIDVVFHPSTKIINKLDKQNISHLYYKYAVVNQYKQITYKCRKTFTFDNRIYKCDVSNGYYITNGWPSIKKKIMHQIKFNDSLYATEDLDFISRVVKFGYNVAIFKKPLGFYIKDFTCNVNSI